MNPSFSSYLVNDVFGDPGVYVEIRWSRRALLFDLGQNDALEPTRLLRATDIFISHTHMDHFIGFDAVLRVALGRGKTLRLFGPPGLIDNVQLSWVKIGEAGALQQRLHIGKEVERPRRKGHRETRDCIERGGKGRAAGAEALTELRNTILRPFERGLPGQMRRIAPDAPWESDELLMASAGIGASLGRGSPNMADSSAVS